MGSGNAHCVPEHVSESSIAREGADEIRPRTDSSQHDLRHEEATGEAVANTTAVLPFIRKWEGGGDIPDDLPMFTGCAACHTCCHELPASELQRLAHSEENTGDRVFVNVYDLNDKIKRVNSVSLGLGLGGALHVGVEIADREWSFCMSGVCGSKPRRHQIYIFRQTLDMGRTPYSCADVKRTIRTMRQEWRGDDYDILDRNCGTFGDALCVALGVGNIPSWVTRLAANSGKIPAARQLADFCMAERTSDSSPVRRNVKASEGTSSLRQMPDPFSESSALVKVVRPFPEPSFYRSPRPEERRERPSGLSGDMGCDPKKLTTVNSYEEGASPSLPPHFSAFLEFQLDRGHVDIASETMESQEL